MAVSTEELEEEFSAFGVKANESQLNTCLGFCHRYGLSEEQLVENWLAFSNSFLPSNDRTLKDANLDKFDEYLGKQVKTASTPKAVLPQPKITSGVESNIGKSAEIISTYGSKAPEAKTPSTPATGGIKRSIDITPEALKEKNAIGPVGASDLLGRYRSRTNSGQVVTGYGGTVAQWVGDSWLPKVEVLRSLQEYKYMHQSLREESLILDDVITELGNTIVSENELEDLANPTKQHPEPVVCIGRICCEAADSRLSASSVLLQGNVAHAKGGSTNIDLKGLQSYGLFPGQIVAVKGNNPTGKTIHVSELYYPKVDLPVGTTATGNKDSLHMVMASGPFHLGTSLNFAPLDDLLNYVRRSRPHILLLFGPLISSKKMNAENWPSNRTFKEEFEAVVERIDNGLESLDTRTFLVSSCFECCGLPVYPTPTYSVKPKRFSVVPDPVFLDVEGVKISATSSDIYAHLANQEISSGSSNVNREQRIPHYLLEQKSMYPLYPPSLEMNIDVDHWESHARIEEPPHILVLPSDYKAFIRVVDGCMVINPERIVKGDSGGTFSRISVNLKSGSVGNDSKAEVVFI